MFNVKQLNPISDAIYKYLKQDKYTVSKDTQEYDAILVRSAKCHDMEFPQSLEAIARAGAGVNNIPIERCTKDGIVVFNTPGANANGVKELVLAAMFIASRNILEATSWAKTLIGKGDEVLPLVEKGKSQFVGPELAGKTLGVIGLGAIGVMVANAAHSLDMKVIGYDPYISIESAWGLSQDVSRAHDLDELIAKSDYITLHIPLMDKTKKFIGKEEFAKMKSNVVILNFARNGLLDYEPLFDALDNNKIGRYVTDFPNERLLEHDNVISIPHLGASTPESEENCAKMAAKQLRNYLEEGRIVNSVNMPECTLAFTGQYRIAVIHENTSGMVGKMTAMLAELGANITDMMNKSRGDIAYTVINLDEKVADNVAGSIGEMDGVIKVKTFVK
ncbi:MAG: 3-phosphoglycerate dehydrogenase [Clostridia bacterium]|jgi:D-3-phosphoglycerate dehydrogenase / 2-oxoglutarate reductase|nr:3-phosphoglycerate dehydrogenase [Clostridia bacterium]